MSAIQVDNLDEHCQKYNSSSSSQTYKESSNSVSDKSKQKSNSDDASKSSSDDLIEKDCKASSNEHKDEENKDSNNKFASNNALSIPKSGMRINTSKTSNVEDFLDPEISIKI